MKNKKNDKRLSKSLSGADYAKVFDGISDHAIAVTIQPNFCRQGSVRSARPIDIYNNVERVRRLVKDLFYDLDRRYLQCPRPQLVESSRRFDGLVVLEKHMTNPHVHIIIRCADPIEQHLRYAFLLEMLSTETNPEDPAEVAAWDFIERQGGWQGDAPGERRASVLRSKAPKGTVKVQLLSSDADKRAYHEYVSKDWQVSARDGRAFAYHQDWEMDFWELRDHNSEVAQRDPARFWAIDPENPSHLTLNLDNAVTWRKSGGRLVR